MSGDFLVEPVVSADQAMKQLGAMGIPVTKGTLYAWARQKKVPSQKIGGRTFFRVSQLVTWLERTCAAGDWSVLPTPPPAVAPPTPKKSAKG